MENFIKQIRLKLTGEEEVNKGDLSGSRHQKMLTKNWFQRELSRKMSGDYDSTEEMEHATAVAATAFAITSQFSEFPQKKKTSSASKRFPGSFTINNDQDNKVPTSSPIREEKKPEETITLAAPSMNKTPTLNEKSKVKSNISNDKKQPDILAAPKKTPTFGDRPLLNTDDAIKPETQKPKLPPPVEAEMVSLRPPPPPPPPYSPIRQASTRQRPQTRPDITETKADAWEREEHRKIKDRYEKLLETIDSWEKRKKMRARRKLNKHEQSENERKRVKARRKYEDKMKYIDEIARGARAQADDRRKNELLKAKEKANIIRTTGKLPGGPCSCF